MAQFLFASPSAQEVSSADFFDKIALVAHNCYQVPQKDHLSNIAFIHRLVSASHLARIEHYRFILSLDKTKKAELLSLQDPYLTIVDSLTKPCIYVSLSLRPMLEHRNHPLYQRLLSGIPEEIKKERILPIAQPSCKIVLLSDIHDDVSSEDYDKLLFLTYHLITDRGVTHEIVRHRPCSFAQESTRYCNYTKGKFDSALTFIKPLKYEEEKEVYDSYYQCVTDTYFRLIGDGLRPDEARSVLPNSLKASIMVSCSREEWKHIFSLRLSEAAHPDIRFVRGLVKNDRVQKGYLSNEEK